MKIIIAPDKFKDCLTAAGVAAAIAEGTKRADPNAQIELCPMADGGEGTVDALVAATQGKLVTRPVTGPLPGMRLDAQFGILGDNQTAVIEMAAASGLHLLSPDQRNPMRTTTYGTGELLRAAVSLGVKKIILGIGGSATVDAGVGCAQAWGHTIQLDNGSTYRATDRRLVGSDVSHVLRIDTRTAPTPHENIEFLVACDVANPLFGPTGAAAVFGPQKGATDEQVKQLDMGLKRLAERTQSLSAAQAPGAGAAGGLGFAMLAFFGAKLRSGIEIVMDATGFRDRLAGADLCITGEGKFDSQSLAGKTAIGVAGLCKEMHVPCIVVAGTIGQGADQSFSHGVDAYFSICDRPMSLEQAMQDAPRLLSNATTNILKAVRLDK